MTSHDVGDEMTAILRNTNVALQIDQSTDITNKAELQAFVRFENEGEIMEFCCCKEQPEATKGQGIFNLLSSYLQCCGLSWNQCVGICTDGAPSVIGSIKGFCYIHQSKNYYVITTRNFLYRVLVSKLFGKF
jgi:hypothetical protein